MTDWTRLIRDVADFPKPGIALERRRTAEGRAGGVKHRRPSIRHRYPAGPSAMADPVNGTTRS